MVNVWLAYLLVSIFGLLCSLIPLKWHWHLPTPSVPMAHIIWYLAFFNLTSLVNCLIWRTDVQFLTNAYFSGHIYCDVETKLILAANGGIVAAALVLSKRLCFILDEQTSGTQVKRNRKVNRVVDALLLYGVPLWFAGVHYIVQPYRYQLFAITGCQPVKDNSWPSIVLLVVWPPILGAVAGYYAAVTIYRLNVYRIRWHAILRANGNLDRGRFWRLLFTALTVIILTFPFGIYRLYMNCTFEFLPYDWTAIHTMTSWDWVEVVYTGDKVVLIDSWVPAVAAACVTLFYVCSRENLREFRRWRSKVAVRRLGAEARRIGVNESSRGSAGSLQGTGRGGRGQLGTVNTSVASRTLVGDDEDVEMGVRAATLEKGAYGNKEVQVSGLNKDASAASMPAVPSMARFPNSRTLRSASLDPYSEFLTEVSGGTKREPAVGSAGGITVVNEVEVDGSGHDSALEKSHCGGAVGGEV